MVQIKTGLIIMSNKTLLSEIKVWPKLKLKISIIQITLKKILKTVEVILEIPLCILVNKLGKYWDK